MITRTVTILNGQSLSGDAQIDGAALVGIIMPSAWTAADLTFQASGDDAVFNDMYDVDGAEVTVVAGASRYIWLSPNDFVGFDSIKVRSGTTGTPVNQGADRSITLVLLGL